MCRSKDTLLWILPRPPVPSARSSCGLYLRRFYMNAEDLTQKIYLNFEGVDSCFYLWINEQFAGYSQVSHSTSEFDITDLLNEGENSVAVLVVKWRNVYKRQGQS